MRAPVNIFTVISFRQIFDALVSLFLWRVLCVAVRGCVVCVYVRVMCLSLCHVSGVEQCVQRRNREHVVLDLFSN